MIVYATAEQLTDWIGATPDADNIGGLLRQASILVGRACRNDLYDVDGAGKPADPDLVEAMRDATCAQVELWIEAGINAVAGASGVTAGKASTTVDGASVTYNTADLTAAAASAAESTSSLTDTALAILRNVGLASGWV